MTTATTNTTNQHAQTVHDWLQAGHYMGRLPQQPPANSDWFAQSKVADTLESGEHRFATFDKPDHFTWPQFDQTCVFIGMQQCTRSGDTDCVRWIVQKAGAASPMAVDVDDTTDLFVFAEDHAVSRWLTSSP
jgi:hypothetical protein